MFVVWSYIANDSDHFCIKTILPGKIISSDILRTSLWVGTIYTFYNYTPFCFRLDPLAQAWTTQRKVGNKHEFYSLTVKLSNHTAKSKEDHFHWHQCLKHSMTAKNSWVLTLFHHLCHQCHPWASLFIRWESDVIPRVLLVKLQTACACIVKPPAFMSTH